MNHVDQEKVILLLKRIVHRTEAVMKMRWKTIVLFH